jgi:hypothetical protein
MPKPEKLIAAQQAKVARLNARIKALQVKRDLELKILEELQDSLTPEPTTSKNPITETGAQPFRGSQQVILEKRTLRGKLDFTGEQPPTGGMTFDDVWSLYANSNPKEWDGSWPTLRAWLDSKGWVVRAKTW